MTTQAQNPRYSYLTFNRDITGTGSFELDIAGSTIYRLDTNTSTLQVRLNNSGNSEIPLISKRRIDVGSNGFTKIIVSFAGIVGTESIQLLIGDSESSNTDLGVEISEYSSTVTGSVTITGTPDVNIAEINGSTTASADMEEYYKGSSTLGVRRVGYGIINQSAVLTTIYTVPAGTESFLHMLTQTTSVSAAAGGLTYIYLYSAGGVLLTALSVSQLTTIVGNEQTQVFNFPDPGLKMIAAETLRVVSNANVFQNYTFYLTERT